MKTYAEIVSYCQAQIARREDSLQSDNANTRRSLRLVSEIGAYRDVIAFLRSTSNVTA